MNFIHTYGIYIHAIIVVVVVYAYTYIDFQHLVLICINLIKYIYIINNTNNKMTKP